MTFDTGPTNSATTAAEAFALKRGVCQDLTHIFIAAARSLGIPARYIGGHFFRSDGATGRRPAMPGPRPMCPILAGSAFDAANGICATDAHVRVAVGSTISARPRCAAPAMAAAMRRSTSRCASRRAGRQTQN